MYSLVYWYEVNHIQLNISKTKELMMYLRRPQFPVTHLVIGGQEVEIVQVLGVHIDSKLNWSKNSLAVF